MCVREQIFCRCQNFISTSHATATGDFFARSHSRGACLYFLSKQISSNLYFPPELNAIKSLCVCRLGVLVCLVNWGLCRRGLAPARCSPVDPLKSIKMQYIFIPPRSIDSPGCRAIMPIIVCAPQ